MNRGYERQNSKKNKKSYGNWPRTRFYQMKWVTGTSFISRGVMYEIHFNICKITINKQKFKRVEDGIRTHAHVERFYRPSLSTTQPPPHKKIKI